MDPWPAPYQNSNITDVLLMARKHLEATSFKHQEYLLFQHRCYNKGPS